MQDGDARADLLETEGGDLFVFPASFSQRRLWLLDRLEPASAAYNLPFAVRFSGRLNVAALERSLVEIARRHESLRTVFRIIEDEPAQLVLPPPRTILETVDLRGISDREETARKLVSREAWTPFDLEQGPLWRAVLVRLELEESLLLLSLHHIVSDGWSMGVLVQEVAALYAAFCQGRPSPLAELSIQYADFTLWQQEWLRGEILESQLSYWRTQLSGVPVLQLPTDHAPAARPGRRGGKVEVRLSKDLSVRLHELSRQRDVTLFMTLLAAFQVLLGRSAGQEDFAVGFPIANRHRSELAGLIGFFANTLVLRADLSGDPTFENLLARVREATLGAYAHQDVSFEILVKELEPERSLTRSPLFQVMLVLQNAPAPEIRFSGLQMRSVPIEQGMARLDLALELVETGSGLSGALRYDRDLVARSTILRMLERFEMILQSIAVHPQERLSMLDVLPEGERHQIVAEWNDTAVAATAPACLHELFALQARRDPRAVAAIHGEDRLTYGQLDERSNQLARCLQRLGVGPESRVGLCLEPSLELLVAILGTLKAGGAYVPLDPAYPRERLSLLIEDALGIERTPLLLTQEKLESLLPVPADAKVFRLDADWDEIAVESPDPVAAPAPPERLLYVIYTSGSTNVAKGVLATHGGLVNFARGFGRALALGPQDRLLLFAPTSFDASALQLLAPLVHGAAVVIHRNPRELANYEVLGFCERHGVTVLDLPAALWRQWVEDVAARHMSLPVRVRAFLTGGETVPVAKLRTWARLADRPIDFLSSYGPTEATVTATVFQTGNDRVDDLVWANVPIGRPLPNVRAYVLDRQMRPVPRGVAGELFLGGAGLARGYLGLPGLTAEAFVPDPLAGEAGGRLYRTGDLARHLPDGNLEFLGRADLQIKIRGFRVELAEIESVLARHPAVEEAVVALREDQPGNRRLVGYLVLHGGEAVPGVRELREFLAERLPSHVIPAAFVTLPALAVLPSGKVNRAALPAPEAALQIGGGHIAPQTAAEKLLAGIWQQMLGVERVGLHDNFFELGGDSILSIQIAGRAHQAGLVFNPGLVFQHPTVFDLARVSGMASAPRTEEQGMVSGDVPLTPIQSWFFEQASPEPHYFNQAILLETSERLDGACLELALAALLEHHDALRLRFVQDGAQWRQTNAGSEPGTSVIRIDLAAVPADRRQHALTEAAAQLQTAFDLSRGPLTRIALFGLGAQESGRLFWLTHHLAVDGVSWRVLLEDLATAFRQIAAGGKPELPAKTTSFRAWALRLLEHARSETLRSELPHWLAVAQEEVPGLPRDLAPTPEGDANRVFRSVSMTLSSEETRSLLQDIPAVYRTEINDVLLTALAQAVAPWTGSSRLRVDLEGHGREPLFADVDLSRTVGWFTTQFPVLIDVGAAAGPGAALNAVREQLRRVSGRGIGYGLLRYASGDPQIELALRQGNPPEIGFNYLGQLDRGAPEPSLFRAAAEPTGPSMSPRARRPHRLEVSVAVTGGRLHGTFSFSSILFRRSTVESVAEAFAGALRQMVSEARKLAALSLPGSALARLGPSELDRLLAEAGAPVEDLYPASPLQQGMLFHTLHAPDSGVYVGQMGLTLQTELDEDAFERAWRELVQRHAVLRTAFFWRELDEPLQVVHQQVRIPWERHDWRDLGAAEQQRRLAVLLAEDRRRGFDLSSPPLLRLILIRQGRESYHFVWSSHHILLDGWSTPILLRDVFALYEAALHGREPRLKPPRPYRDYIEWLEQQDRDETERFWRRILNGFLSTTPLGIGRSAAAASPSTGELTWRTRTAGLAAATTEALGGLARRHQVTLHTILQGAWTLLLHRYSGEDDIVFGTVTAGRSAPLEGIESMVGLFINTLPARVQISAQADLPAWLRSIQVQQAEMRRHEHSSLARVQAWSQVPRGTPLFESVLDYTSYPVDGSVREIAMRTVRVAAIEIAEQTNYPLLLSVSPGSRLGLKVSYDSRRLEPTAVARLLGHLEVLLESIPVHENRPLAALPLLTEPERHQILGEWNATGRPSSGEPLVHRWIEAQVERAPSEIAVEIDGVSLTYTALDERASQLARFLRRLGVAPGELVGVAAERSLEMVVALLGILKAGGAYVPLDPSYPQERIDFMLADALAGSRTAVLLTQDHLARRFDASVRVVRLDADWPAIAGESPDRFGEAVSPDALAYVIYTSGSTGRPKGAMNTHRAICNRLLWSQQSCPLSGADRVLHKTPFSFDVSVWELFWPLMAGARLVLARPEGHKDAEYLAGVIAARRVTTLHFVPSMLQAFLESPGLDRCRSLRRVIASGEALSRELARRFFATLRGVDLLNLYGPTEAAVEVSCHPCQPGAEGAVPIGRPIANLSLYLLDPAQRLAPAEVAGELYIGGAGLARGYHGRPDLTAERFVPHPFSDCPGERLYRTGDVARFLPDGEIEYLGRTDQQVKIRGFRIEPGEIETVLAGHPEVREAVVMGRRDPPGEPCLAAYVVPMSGGVSAEALRSFLRRSLPEHMVPQLFVMMEALPLSPNGKVDRRRLPAPERRSTAFENGEPRNRTEATMAAIWREILRMQRIGIHDNFFELGGDSILSLQIVSRAARAGMRLSPRQVFENPTIASLAALAETAPGTWAEEVPATGPVPLTPIQHWFLDQDLAHPDHFNQAVLLEADRGQAGGGLDPTALHRALQHLLARHDALSFRFEAPAAGHPSWRQIGGAPLPSRPLVWIDLSNLPDERQRAALEAAAAKLQASLDLGTGALLRAALLTLGGERPDRFLMVIHHLAVDGVSWRILLEDLETAYRQLAAGGDGELPPGTASFRRWAGLLAGHARSSSVVKQGRYWLERLREPLPRLPVDLAEGDNDIASVRSVTVALDPEETRALLRDIPRTYHAQINDALLTALADVLGAWTDSHRLLLDLEGHGREEILPDVDLSRTVGWLTSLFPVVLDLEAAATPVEALRRVKEELRGIPDRGVPYGLLRYLGEGEISERLRALPAAEVVFNYLGQLDSVTAEGRLFRPARESVGAMRAPQQLRSHLLEVNSSIHGGRLRVSWSYTRNRYLRATVEALAARFVDVLRSLIASCRSPMAGACIPSDFPLARLEGPDLDRLVAAAGGPIEDIYPATPTQQGMLFHSLHAPESGVYIGQVSFVLGRELDGRILEESWRQVVARHSVLRTGFYGLDLDTPLQVVRREVALPWSRLDWSGLTGRERSARLSSHLAADLDRGFDLATAPLIRLTLIDLGAEGSRLVWAYHHAILDGWSMPILLREVFSLYGAGLRGEEPVLGRVPPYRDYVAWLESQDLVKAEERWRHELAGFASPTPLRKESGTAAGPTDGQGVLDAILSATVTDSLRSFARRHRLTLNTLVHGAWALLLCHYSGDEDVVFGVVTSGRSAPVRDIDSMVGLFINTLPARVRLSPEDRLLPWLVRLQERQAEVRQHEHSPLALVQGWSDIPRGRSLFESILAFENYPMDESVRELAGQSVGVAQVSALERTSYALTVAVALGARLSLRISYRAGQFDRPSISRLQRHLATLLEGMLTRVEAPPGSLSLLTPEERQQILVEWNATGTRSPGEACLHRRIERQAERTPQNVAAVFEDEELSYAELNARANRLARRLRRCGVGVDVPVGICVERSLEMLIGLLGILKAGGAYVPLDPSYPLERLSYLLEDALGGLEAPVLLTLERLSSRFGQGNLQVIALDAEKDVLESGANLSSGAAPDNLAYVIYTSGSTGRPKGAMNTHRAICNRLLWMQELYRLDERERVLQKTPFGFDVSVWELFGPLLAGACVVFAQPDGHRDPAYLVGLIERHGITMVHFVPSMLRIFLEQPGVSRCSRSLRRVTASGEALPRDLVQRFFSRLQPAELHNLYGPTEAAVEVTFHACAPGTEDRSVPIGRSIANLEIYLEGASGQPVPLGTPGELLIGGAGLARGYLGRPDLTAEKFVPHSWGAPGERLYRTGDLARWLSSGEIEYLGRIDHQVKVRGFRIELEEIEATLGEHSAVQAAAVVVKEGQPGEARLIACVVLRDEGARQDELRGFLKNRLPEYMVPAAFLAVDALPLLPNGKVDRRDLQRREPEAPAEGGQKALGTPLEEVLAGIFAEVLRKEQVGAEDSFFELGGHSLLATQVISRVRSACGVELPMRALFEAPTVRALAGAVSEALREGLPLQAPPLQPALRDGTVPLSFAQQRLWFLHQMEPSGSAYNIAAAVRLTGRLDGGVLAASLNEVVARHEVLRTAFPADAVGMPVQRIAPPPHNASLSLVDLAGLPEAAREWEARRLAAAEGRRPFDLVRGPLLRATLLRLESEEHAGFFTLHHIVSDGWSMGILIGELMALYPEVAAGRPPALPPLPVQYADFALWQRSWLSGEALAAHLAYWRERLAGAPPALELPTDRPRSAGAGRSGASRTIRLEPEQAASLASLSRSVRSTLFTILLAVWKTLLFRITGQTDLLVGTPVANRTRPEIEGLIGCFVNTLVLRSRPSCTVSFLDLAAQVRDGFLRAHAHQELPFERLVEELAPERSLTHAPLFQVLFNLQDAPPAFELPGLALAPFEQRRETAQFDLTLSLTAGAGWLAGALVYDSELFDATTIDRIAGYFVTLVSEVAIAPGRSLSELSMLSREERHQLLEWGRGPAVCRTEELLHEPIAVQAALTPEAVAVSFEGDSLTYDELDLRASRLARQLQTLGCGPDAAVGILMERSLEMMVAILAVLKAGGAYMPFDPEAPGERLAWMLASARPPVLLTQEHLRRRLPAYTARVLSLEPGWRGEESDGDSTPRCEASPDNLAYVLYTSGSTGRPKGVMISHRAIVNHMRWMRTEISLAAADAVLQKTPFTFDASVWELFLPLWTGARLVMALPGVHQDPASLARTVASQRVTVLQLVPSVLEAFLAEPAVAACSGLRRLFVGGEALAPALPERVFALLDAELCNLYGPTECAVEVVVWRFPRGEARTIAPIGRPVWNVEIHLLDEELQPVPLGSCGHLHIGGLPLGRGYLGRPDLTAERFIPDPCGGEEGGRLYRTGDLARYLPDGVLAYLGRTDHQVKVRGFRIELSEIEAVLLEHPDVRAAVVTAQSGERGQRLVAYWVPRGERLQIADVRGALARRLPSYMVPAAFVPLAELPLTPSGKIDRKALPEPEEDSGAVGSFVGPRDPVEEMLAAIWAEVLGCETIGVHENFFDLGGHSLLATQVISRIRNTLGIEIALRTLFETPTVAGLAEGLRLDLRREEGSALPPLLPSRPEDRGRAPLTFAQQRLWFLDQLEPGSAAYNIPVAVRLTGRLDAAALELALAEVVRRHEALRTVFPVENGEPAQLVTEAAFLLPRVDLTGLEARSLVVRELAREDAHRPFQLARGPLIRPVLLCLAGDDHVLLATMHHIVSDGWSIGVLLHELMALYKACRAGSPSPLKELPFQLGDYARWQRSWLSGEVVAREIDFWRRRLEGMPVRLELPTDRPRPAVRTTAGATRPLTLRSEEAARLRSAARSGGVTLFMALLAGLQALLFRLSGQDDLGVGIPVAGRDRLETEGLIGLFLNTLVIRGNLAGPPTVRELLSRVRSNTLEAYAHQAVPFEKLVDELAPERSLSHTPLFQVMFVLQNAASAVRTSFDLPELSLFLLGLESSTAKFDLTLSLSEGPGGILGSLEYNKHLFDATTADRIIGQLKTLLGAMAASPESRVTELSVLSPVESRQILTEWNDTRAAFRTGACLQDLFDEQVERAPEAPAVLSAEGEAMSYRQLSHRANQLAHHLERLGTGPGVMVAVYLDRSPEMIVALLGILKTGAVYVPLDGTYPEARIAWILSALGIRQIVTQESRLPVLRRVLDRTVLTDAVCLDVDRSHLDLLPTRGLPARATSNDLAYVIFTSGTTGTPKGVMVRHEPVINLIEWVNRTFAVGGSDRLLFITSLCFDLSVYDIFGMLAAGGSIRVASDAEVQDPESLLRILFAEPITFWDSAPPALQQLAPFLPLASRVSGPLPGSGDLRLVFLSGDWIPVHLPDQVRTVFPVARVISLGGATEATVWSNFHSIGAVHPAWASIPYGRPIQNARYHVLDAALAPCPIGGAGDLYIGGDCLSAGYLDDPELTAGKYIPDPFAFLHGDLGARLYRTGDRARYWPDGTIEFLGRADQQVKIRGFRIELGEIETALASHPAVREAVVLARRAPSGDQVLVGYVVAAPAGEPSLGELRDHLRARLPEYMVPATIVTLETLPLTANGKLDRRALPDPAIRQSQKVEFVAPRTPAEQTLAGIWAEVLGLGQVGVLDDFFQLGGHSLVATRIIARIRESFNVQLPVRDLFSHPTVEALAARVEEAVLEASSGEQLDELLNYLEQLEAENLEEVIE